ncbi:hypothetical protein [Curtobacterium sp. MCBA15_001]|uniref:DUF7255 family protein n=1 Tax=Curtobacterium sp. MCBA15_001 TaxID=1898731 RepID=UPI0008DD5651|nr:hypothetical protein [Curtobacterium sp. MCBA15_001]OIH92844.1 hypothetical protein BIU90_10150 [Curtobacterium sp. MCBA15_001]
MTKTGARATALDRAMQAAGLRPAPIPARLRLEDLPDQSRAAVLDLYRGLGGLLEYPVLRPGSWDLAYAGVLVELDEDMHFNRYRAATLETPFASSLPWATDYREFAAMHERRSGTGGRRWTNPSAERMFGPADPHWMFEGNGAPRWKQRALYDAMKDAAASAGIVRLSRISVHDRIDRVLVEDHLRGRASIAPDRLRAFVERRTHQAEVPRTGAPATAS